MEYIRPRLGQHRPGLIPERELAGLTDRLIAGELFTDVVAELAREPVSARVVRSESELSWSEGIWLRTDPDTRGSYRRGELRTARSNRLAARVTSVFLPHRIDAETVSLLATTAIPLGKALAPRGARRELLWVMNNPAPDVALWTCGRLWLPRPDGRAEWPVAIATEQIP